MRPGVVHLEDAERGRLFLGDGDDRHRRVGVALAVGLQHLRVVHAVELIARQDQDVARRRAPHVPQALADGVGGALEPVAAFLGLLGGQHADERRREHVELVGHRDVLVQALRVELRQHEDLAQARVQAVADRDVDQPVLAADRYGRLRALEREREQARAAATAKNDRQHVVHRHSVAIYIRGPSGAPRGWSSLRNAPTPTPAGRGRPNADAGGRDGLIALPTPRVCCPSS